jgi:hypothetical protein
LEHNERRQGDIGLTVYGGLYGIWLGVAVPAGLDVDEAPTYGMAIIAGAPIGAWSAWRYARGAGISKGQAGLVSLAGNFGTWQGLGWAGVNDTGARDVMLIGAACGTAALLGAAVMAPRVDVSYGQTTLLHSATSWGAWYGVAAAQMAGSSGENVVASALVGSAAGLALSSAWCARNDISSDRARILSLGGILGLATGFGLDLIIQPEDDGAIFALPAAASLAGMTWAALRTQDDVRRAAAHGVELDPMPRLSLAPGGGLRVDLLHGTF